MRKTEWMCKACNCFGCVEHKKDTTLQQVLTAISLDHDEKSRNCKSAQLSTRVSEVLKQ